MATLNVRLATPADAPSLVELQRSSITALVGVHYSARQVEAFIAHAAASVRGVLATVRMWVATDGGRIVASAAWRSKSVEGASAAELRSVFVHADWKRRGLAARLVGRAEFEARQAGLFRVELLAMLGSEPFYRARGYEPAGMLSLDVCGVPFPGRLMTKTIG
jgi:predicted N-acetyltransferase YhbS